MTTAETKSSIDAAEHNTVMVLSKSNYSTPSGAIVEVRAGHEYERIIEDTPEALPDWISDIVEQGSDVAGVLFVYETNLIWEGDDAYREECEGARGLTDEEWERAKKGEQILD